MQYQIVWDQKQNTLEEATVTQEYLNELEADVLSIDFLIAFAGSEKGEQVFWRRPGQTYYNKLYITILHSK